MKCAETGTQRPWTEDGRLAGGGGVRRRSQIKVKHLVRMLMVFVPFNLECNDYIESNIVV